MTNREKASEIAEDFSGAFSGAIKMAEWKDNILREEREKAIEKFNEYYDNHHLSLSMASRYAGIVFFVDKLFGEDSREKLHCAFVTLD